MFVRLVRASTLVLLLIQVMSTLVLLATADNSVDLNDESVYKDLMDGTRGILIIGTLVHGNSTIVMIAQLNNAGELISYDDIYVYQLATTYNTSKLVLKGGQMLKDKWPALQDDIVKYKPSTVALLPFEDVDFFLTFGYSATAFALEWNITEVAPFPIPRTLYDQGYKIISSTERSKIFTIYFDGRLDVQKKSLGYFKCDNPCYKSTFFFKDVFCVDSSSSMVTMKNGELENCGACTWTIQAGFMDENQIILFDKDKSVYKFPKVAIEDSQNNAIKFETSSFGEFFESPDGKLTTTTSTTNGPPSTNESTSDSSSVRSSDEPHSKAPNPNTGGHHPQDYTTISEAKGSNGGLIAGIVIFVIALIAAAVGAYLYFCYCNSSDKNNLPKEELKGSSGKQTGGKGAKSLLAIAGKLSRRNSRASGKSRGGKSLAKSRGALRSKRSAGKPSRGALQGDAAKSSRPSLQVGFQSRRRTSPSLKRANLKGRVPTGRLSGARPSSARPSASLKTSQKR